VAGPSLNVSRLAVLLFHRFQPGCPPWFPS
jgi:hypothetical protein